MIVQQLYIKTKILISSFSTKNTDVIDSNVLWKELNKTLKPKRKKHEIVLLAFCIGYSSFQI